MRSPALAAALLLCAGRLSAQAPVVTPQGDPSVDPDTIYALAVDPADHPDEDALLLLDDGVVVQNADGTGSRTYRQITQVLTRDAVARLSELGWGYDGERQDFHLNWARVVKPDGTVVSAEPIHQQTADVPVPQQSPIYTAQKQVRVSLGAVAPGTLVDVSWTIRTVKPVLADEFTAAWSISTGSTVRRSRFVLDVPEGWGVRIREKHVKQPATVSRGGGRTVHTWTAADVERLQPEIFVDARHTVYPTLEFGGPLTWDEVGAWYARLARERYVLDDSVRAAAEAATAEAATPRAKLVALHRWIAQDIRYISIALGKGGYQPRLPADVLRTRSGDCKDKATLFVLLARELGFEAYPVLLNSRGGRPDDLPTVHAFDHEIAAVRLDGAWTFVDLTADIIPFGRIPPQYEGGFGLLVHDDGSVERVTFPETGPSENETLSRVTGEISADGAFSGTAVTEAHGSPAFALRMAMARELSERQRTQLAAAMAAGLVRGARGDNLQLFDGLDFSAQPKISVDVHADAALQPSGNGYLLTLPIPDFATTGLIPKAEDEVGRRRNPISVDQVSGPVAVRGELVLTLPEGWTADLPPDVSVDGVWGTYRARYAQDGRTLTITREIRGARGSQPADALPDLIRWLKAVAKDDVRVVGLRTGG